MSTSVVQTILEKDEASVRACLRSIADGVALVELRLDAVRDLSDPVSLIEQSPRPVIATVRRKDQGGLFEGTEESRLQVLESVARSSAQYVDLEMDVPRPPSLPVERALRSDHDFQGLPEDLEHRVASMGEDAALVKVAALPQSMKDVFRLFNLPRVQPRLSIVSIAMGTLGEWGRLAAGALDVPLTYAATPAGSPAAPGQVFADVMTEVYRAHHIDPTWSFVLCPGYEVTDPQVRDWNRAASQTKTCFLPLSMTSIEDLEEVPLLLDVRGALVNAPWQSDGLEWATEATERAKQAGRATVLDYREGTWIADDAPLEADRFL